MKAALVIMAAGLGSRYGGEKQVDGMGPNGETIMEYSMFDAVQAGFTKVVLIIKPHMRELVEEIWKRRLAALRSREGAPIELVCVAQDFDSIPAFYSIPAERVKPFGTVHAALCAKDAVSEPFALINADDYYGPDAYVAMFGALKEMAARGSAAMVGYRLKNTVSAHGTVTRGVCIQEGGKLRGLKETYQIGKKADGTIWDMEHAAQPVELHPETLVSMNFWGFTPWIFEEMERYFHAFLRGLAADDLKGECLLPAMVDAGIAAGWLEVSVLSTDAQWFGVTYREDRDLVREALRAARPTL